MSRKEPTLRESSRTREGQKVADAFANGQLTFVQEVLGSQKLSPEETIRYLQSFCFFDADTAKEVFGTDIPDADLENTHYNARYVAHGLGVSQIHGVPIPAPTPIEKMA